MRGRPEKIVLCAVMNRAFSSPLINRVFSERLGFWPSRYRAATLSVCLIAIALFCPACRKVDDRVEKSRQPKIFKTATGAEMALIPAGWFEMGTDRGKDDEKPIHKVWVDAFLMDRYEATQEQYGKLVLGNPSHFKGPRLPVEQISWADAALYCNARSRHEGLSPCYDEETAECNFEANGYRLPTEAEWEYACRSGVVGGPSSPSSDMPYFFGRDVRKLKLYAWYADNSSKKTHPVGTRKPNSWGLYDMYGNVAEWCNDVYSESYYGASPAKNPRGPTEGEKYVLRGGAWNSSADACRSSYRVGEDPGFQDACFARDAMGFRCVRKAPDNASARSKPKEIRSRKTGFVYDPIYLEHKTSEGHPERPQRLIAIAERLKETGLTSKLARIPPRAASLKWVATIHTQQYVERVRKSCEEGVRYLDTRDVPISKESYKVALTAVGGVLAAIDAVMEGKVKNAFCAVRPPGHHALRDKAMGFCIFNNVAIAARYIQEKHKLPKILIVDWDVHHGNGTQDVFYDDPTVLYFGIHQYPFYPGTGSEAEKGEGRGLGYTVNAPLPAGSGDEDYERALEEKLKPAALAFNPDFVLISAGFDPHKDDPIGGMKVTSKGFAELTRIVKEIAERCCNGRLVSVLEGGYNLQGLADSVAAHIRVLAE